MVEPTAIAVLAKAPVAGLAKTRLIPALGADGAAALQARLIERSIATARAAGTGPVTLWATPDAAHPLFQSMQQRHRVTLARQPEGDLGARMLAAAGTAQGPVLVIGTDCPALTAGHLHAAADALRSHDAVLVPAEDGGYVLIGLRRPQPALFTDMPWGTASVMAETRARARGLGLTALEMEILWDVDRPEDLRRLEREGLLD